MDSQQQYDADEVAANQREMEAEGTDEAQGPSRLNNPPAVGAVKDWLWGYLPCGCMNDGYGRHIR